MTKSNNHLDNNFLSSLPEEILSLPFANEDDKYQVSAISLIQWVQHRTRLNVGKPYITIPKAILVPPAILQNDMSSNTVQGGVCSANGKFEPIAHHYSSLLPWIESSGEWKGNALTKPWRVLYGGVAREHFGHFINETLGRIWVTFDNFDQICFLRSPVGPPSVNGLELLKLFEGLPPITIVDVPLQVDEAVIPLQGSASELGLLCLRQFAVNLRERLAPKIHFGGGHSIYVSRSRYNSHERRKFSGSIVQEKLLEERLSAVGYKIYHPQEHTVAHQIATYRSAANILINEGTALHLVALSASSTTQVAVLGRRLGLLATFESYLEIFLEMQPLRRVLRSGFHLDINNWGEQWLVIDYPTLSEQLVRRGMLPEGTSWSSPQIDLTEIHQRIAQLGSTTLLSRQS